MQDLQNYMLAHEGQFSLDILKQIMKQFSKQNIGRINFNEFYAAIGKNPQLVADRYGDSASKSLRKPGGSQQPVKIQPQQLDLDKFQNNFPGFQKYSFN